MTARQKWHSNSQIADIHSIIYIQYIYAYNESNSSKVYSKLLSLIILDEGVSSHFFYLSNPFFKPNFNSFIEINQLPYFHRGFSANMLYHFYCIKTML